MEAVAEANVVVAVAALEEAEVAVIEEAAEAEVAVEAEASVEAVLQDVEVHQNPKELG